MALYNRADLHDRFRRLVKRPAPDASINPEDIDRYLSDAQVQLMGTLAIHVPAANRPVKELLTTSDSGKTYTLAEEPVGHVEIYSNLRASTPLIAGAAWDHGADFEWEGLQTIRMIGDRARTFTDGPYAHYVPIPPEISDTQEPTILPKRVRILLPYAAAVQYASEGGLHDPSFYHALYQQAWTGDPAKPGDIGILGELRLRYEGRTGPTERPWWRSPDLSTLPVGP